MLILEPRPFQVPFHLVRVLWLMLGAHLAGELLPHTHRSLHPHWLSAPQCHTCATPPHAGIAVNRDHPALAVFGLGVGAAVMWFQGQCHRAATLCGASTASQGNLPLDDGT